MRAQAARADFRSQTAKAREQQLAAEPVAADASSSRRSLLQTAAQVGAWSLIVNRATGRSSTGCVATHAALMPRTDK